MLSLGNKLKILPSLTLHSNKLNQLGTFGEHYDQEEVIVSIIVCYDTLYLCAEYYEIILSLD